MTNRLDSRHRAEQAARMSATGATWQEVADALGYRSRQAARQAVDRLYDRTPPESVEKARRKHNAALQLLQRNDFTRYLLALKAGDDETAIKYSKELRGIIAERAKIDGAYAPERVDVNVSADPSAALVSKIAEVESLLLERARQRELMPGSVIDAEVEEIEG